MHELSDPKLRTLTQMNTYPDSWPQQFPYPTWYLDAVSGSAGWDYIRVDDAEGNLQGLLPFQLRRRWGLRFLTSPPLSPRLGPWIRYPKQEQTEQQKLAYLHRVLTALDEALPEADYYRISWPYELTYGMPWQMRGWQQRLRYSYVLPLEKATTQLWKALKPSLRNKIRKGEKSLRIESSDDWQLLFQLVDEVFLYRNVSRQLAIDQVKDLHQAARQQKACQLWLVYDEAGNPHAALWLYYDQTTAYNLLLGSDPAMRQSGAVPFLLWHAIRWAKEQGLRYFDFEGSHLPGVEPFFRSFGAEAWPYNEFVKGKKWLLAFRQFMGKP
ncbi:MAG: GNAT family N-acetyltransferase [Bacteroidota bacterium]